MKHRTGKFLCAGACVLALLAGATGVRAQDQNKPAPPQQKQMSPEEQAQMQAMMQAAMPGPAQQQLAKRAGEYTRTSKFEIPGAPSAQSTGTAKITTVLGGRFLQEENSGTFMGQPVSGMRLYGYNNGSKRYEAIWTYTMDTGMLMLSGTSSDNGKTVNYSGTFVNPMGMNETLTVVVTQVDDDHFVVRLTSEGGGGGGTLEESYSRKK